MKSRILRDIRNRSEFAAAELERLAYRYVTHNESLPLRIRLQAQMALNQMPRMTRLVNVKNRCLETGRGRGVLRDFRLCRYAFRLKALRGELPGVIKSCW